MTITREHGRIVFHQPSIATGTFAFLIIVGVVLLAGAVTLVVLASIGILPSDGYIGGGFATLFGLLLLLTGRSRMKQAYETSVTVERHSGLVSYEHTRVPGKLHFGFGEISTVSASQRTESSYSAGDTSTRRTYAVWPVQLELNDGSAFWLATQNSLEEATELVRAISDLTGHPGKVDGEIVAPGDADRTNSYSSDHSQIDASRSPFLVEEENGRERAFTIKRIYTASDLVVLVIIGLLMSTVALAASGLISSEGISFANFNPLGVVGALVPIGIIAFIALLVIRRYRLVLAPESLTVELYFGRGMDRPSRSIVIPRSALRSIQTNRLENGFFRLSLGVDPDLEIPRVSAFLANVGAFKRDPEPGDDGAKSIGLWMIQPWGTAPFGADFRDLRYLERKIERFYELREGEQG